jgi:mannose-1-phosphate guanylyltransferase
MYVVIMAGGKGTRFWPRSRTSFPKQLLDITGGRTMIQETVNRLLPLVSIEKVLVVTNIKQVNDLKLQLPDMPERNIIVEPVGRNTAPCICLASTRVLREDPEEIMAVLPADHYIGDAEGFCTCLEKAAEVARISSSLITIGVSPRMPETGYGYIQFNGQDWKNIKGVHRVEHFHEKPELKQAEKFLKQGNFLWNSGMFVWKAADILNEIENHLPDMFKNIASVDKFWDTPDIDEAIASAYKSIESISIDYGVLEKSANVLVMKADFGWNDIGSWSAVHDISQKDKDLNTLRGDVIAIDSKDIFVYSPKKLTAVVGLRDVIVVETDDALLVCDRHRAQDVRKVVEILEQKGKKEYL